MHPKIVFLGPEGSRDVVEVVPGRSIMRVAKANGVDGIVGECGGNAMCATCHVYIEDSRVPPRSMVEDDMLEFAASECTDSSRLSCQISVTEDLDGLVVTIPSEQL